MQLWNQFMFVYKNCLSFIHVHNFSLILYTSIISWTEYYSYHLRTGNLVCSLDLLQMLPIQVLISLIASVTQFDLIHLVLYTTWYLPVRYIKHVSILRCSTRHHLRTQAHRLNFSNYKHYSCHSVLTLFLSRAISR